MSFDDPTRRALAGLVRECRRLLAGDPLDPTDNGDIGEQLQTDYGIQPDGSPPLPVSGLTQLDDRGREIATELRAWLDHAATSETGTEAERRRDAFKRIVRETAFTALNRLAALRMCEERGVEEGGRQGRGIIGECIRRGLQSDDFALFKQAGGDAFGDEGKAYRFFLGLIFDELAVDLPALFDRRARNSLVFPSHGCLLAVLDQLNAPEFARLWREDETIGWIYQYYNDEAERKKMRRDSPAPRNSRELAVRNQFFTPRYVVEFLTDNTLGRLWYEMTRGETVLRDRCRYLIRRPTEIFLKAGESVPESAADSEAATGENLSQEELLRQPVHIPHRPLKDPREIRLLDPACGSMHFGLYAFDLFEVIYAEWWDHFATDEQKHGLIADCQKAEGIPMQTIVEVEAQRLFFLRHVPRLIVERNIHGIDIDGRAVQIAGLSLWLRAQRSWSNQGLRPVERPRIRRSNLVCAEPMPGEKELLREFVEHQFPVGERAAFDLLLGKVFEKMKQ